MKIIKTASGKKTIKMSRKEWESIGKTAGWADEWGDDGYYENDEIEGVPDLSEEALKEIDMIDQSVKNERE